MARVPTSKTSIWWEPPIDRRSSIRCDVSNWRVLHEDVHSRYPILTLSAVDKTAVTLASTRRTYLNSTESVTQLHTVKADIFFFCTTRFKHSEHSRSEKLLLSHLIECLCAYCSHIWWSLILLNCVAFNRGILNQLFTVEMNSSVVPFSRTALLIHDKYSLDFHSSTIDFSQRPCTDSSIFLPRARRVCHISWTNEFETSIWLSTRQSSHSVDTTLMLPASSRQHSCMYHVKQLQCMLSLNSPSRSIEKRTIRMSFTYYHQYSVLWTHSSSFIVLSLSLSRSCSSRSGLIVLIRCSHNWKVVSIHILAVEGGMLSLGLYSNFS
jgi:hypothetical protein